MLKNIGKILIKRNVGLPRTALNNFAKWSTLRDVLQRLRINCVLDVGANRGQFASTLRDIGYQGHIISFEPLPTIFSELSHQFRTDRSWSGFNYALGAEECVRPFNEGSTAELSSFHSFKSSDRTARVVPVQIKRLDSVYRDLVKGIKDPRVFLKCDTQGFDSEVIAGAGGIIDQILGIQSEIVVSSHYYENVMPFHKNLAQYEALGFSLMGLFDSAFDDKTKAVEEIDCIMARRT